MSEKNSDNAFIRFFRRIGNGLAVIPRKFNEVRQELKKVIWPTKEKMKQVSAVVVVVILAAAIFLTFIEKGTNWVLEQVGFYVQVEETTAATLPSESSAAQTEATTVATTAAPAATVETDPVPTLE
jgi:preprotein translocase subunit SecE